MKNILFVGLGGFLGSIARYKIADWCRYLVAPDRFPFGTLTVNVLGSLVAGSLAGLIARHDVFSPQTRLFLFTGVLGGFTTFSAFGLETMLLLRRGEFYTGALYALGSLVLGVAAVWVGFKVFSSGPG